MTRPDKRAARFGDRYQPPLDWRRFRKAIKAGLPLIKRMTETFRQVAENVRRAREMEETAQQIGAVMNRPAEEVRVILASVANMAAPTLAELEAGTPIRGLRTNQFWIEPPEVGTTTGRMGGHIGPPTDILDRIDHALAYSPDARRVEGDQDWPYRSF